MFGVHGVMRRMRPFFPFLPLSLLLVLWGGCGPSALVEDWGRAATTNDAAAYEEFIRAHPGTRLADRARERLEGMAFARADSEGTVQAYLGFLRAYPGGSHFAEARQKMDLLHPEVFRPEKRVPLQVEQVYIDPRRLPPGANVPGEWKNRKELNLQFEGEVKNMFRHAGLAVGKPSEGVTMRIDAVGSPVGRVYEPMNAPSARAPGSRGSGTTLYTGAAGWGDVTLTDMNGRAFVWKFGGRVEASEVVMGSGSSSSPGNAPYEMALLRDGSFHRALASILHTLYGPEPLVSAMADGDVNVRRGALEVLRERDRGGLPTDFLEGLQRDLDSANTKSRGHGVYARLRTSPASYAQYVAAGGREAGERLYALAVLHDSTRAHPVDVLRAATRDRHAAVRRFAVWRLGKWSGTVPGLVEALLRGLGDDDPGVRRIASESLRNTRDARIVPPLVRLLGDGDPSVRRHAARALSDTLYRSASVPLRLLLRDPDCHVRLNAAYALGAMHDSLAGPDIRELLRDEDPHVRWNAAWAIGRLKDRGSVDALIGSLGDPDFYVRLTSAWALNEVGDRRAGDRLLTCLGDTSVNVRAHVISALGGLGEIRAVPAICREVRTGSPSLTSQACRALGKIGSDDAVDSLMVMLAEGSADLRRHAARGLGVSGSPRAVGPLARIMKEKDYDRRSHAKTALVSLRDAGGLEAALEMIRSAKATDRQWAALALGDMRDERCVGALAAALQDGDREVRSVAADGLGKTGGTQAVAALTGVLSQRDGETVVVTRAIRALGVAGDTTAVPALIRVLDGSRPADVRREAVKTLQGLTGQNIGENKKKWEEWLKGR